MTTTPSDDLKLEIKKLIIETLNIANVHPEEVLNHAPLFGGGNTITLDSVDALEIIMALQRQYKVRIGDQNLSRTVLTSVDTIAEFITTEQSKAANA